MGRDRWDGGGWSGWVGGVMKASGTDVLFHGRVNVFVWTNSPILTLPCDELLLIYRGQGKERHRARRRTGSGHSGDTS